MLAHMGMHPARSTQHANREPTTPLDYRARWHWTVNTPLADSDTHEGLATRSKVFYLPYGTNGIQSFGEHEDGKCSLFGRYGTSAAFWPLRETIAPSVAPSVAGYSLPHGVFGGLV